MLWAPGLPSASCQVTGGGIQCLATVEMPDRVVAEDLTGCSGQHGLVGLLAKALLAASCSFS